MGGFGGSLLGSLYVFFIRIIENEKPLSPLFQNLNSNFPSWLNLMTLPNLLFLRVALQGLQISSRRGPPSRLYHR